MVVVEGKKGEKGQKVKEREYLECVSYMIVWIDQQKAAAPLAAAATAAPIETTTTKTMRHQASSLFPMRVVQLDHQ